MNECVNVSALRLKNLITVCLGAVTLFLGLPLSSLVANTIHVPRDYDTIQEAIDAAGHEDVIEIAAGHYYLVGTLKMPSDNYLPRKAITLRGARTASGQPATVIHGSDNEGRNRIRVLEFINYSYNDGYDHEFENLEFRDGRGGQDYSERHGGGMYCLFASPTLSNCVFKSNSAKGSGGGMYCSNGSPILIDCVFESNRAEDLNVPKNGSDRGYGGGLFCNGGCPVLRNCHFVDNYAFRSGGGAYFSSVDFTLFDKEDNSKTSPLMDCNFTGNEAEGDAPPQKGQPLSTGERRGGGGLYLSQCDYSLNTFSESTLHNCTFRANSSPVGGGLVLDRSGEEEPRLTDCMFEQNLSVCINAEEGNGGAGLAIFNAIPTIIRCDFYDNKVEFKGTSGTVDKIGGGGALRTWFRSGTASQGGILIDDCDFEYNSVIGGASGGALFLDGVNENWDMEINACNFKGNSALLDRDLATLGVGGAVFNMGPGGLHTFANCNFEKNTAFRGGGMFNFHCSLELNGCTFIGNLADEDGGGVCNAAGSRPYLTDCTLMGNSADEDEDGNGVGGGIYSDKVSSSNLTNTTVCGNTPDQIYGSWDDLGGNTVPTPDLNGDGLVDGVDLGLLLVEWGEEGDCLAADFNGDQVVNGADFGLLLVAWSDSP